MQFATRKWRALVTVLLAGIVLRAFVPVGYMPAAPGKGLLFELCHDGLPAGFMQSLGGLGYHEGHSSHGDHEEHAGSGDCSIGHILSMAVIDEVDAPQAAILPSPGIVVAAPLQRLLQGHTGVYSARAPPVP